jgi:hypothetical protein
MNRGRSERKGGGEKTERERESHKDKIESGTMRIERKREIGRLRTER